MSNVKQKPNIVRRGYINQAAKQIRNESATAPGRVRPGAVAHRTPARHPSGRTGSRRASALADGYCFVENAASNAASGASNAYFLTNSSASGAPTRRSIPASSHSTEIGPS